MTTTIRPKKSPRRRRPRCLSRSARRTSTSRRSRSTKEGAPATSLGGYGGIGGEGALKIRAPGWPRADPGRLGLCLISFLVSSFFPLLSLCPLLSVIRNNDTNPFSTFHILLKSANRRTPEGGERGRKQLQTSTAKRKRVLQAKRRGMLRVNRVSIYAGWRGMSICRDHARAGLGRQPR